MLLILLNFSLNFSKIKITAYHSVILLLRTDCLVDTPLRLCELYRVSEYYFQAGYNQWSDSIFLSTGFIAKVIFFFQPPVLFQLMAQV